MHYAGVVQLTMVMVLRHFVVNKGRFRIQTLNSRIESFCYGPVDNANRPSPLKENLLSASNESASVKQSGTIYV